MIEFDSFKALMLDYAREKYQVSSSACAIQCCSVALQDATSPTNKGHAAMAVAAEAEDTENDTAARFDAACCLQVSPTVKQKPAAAGHHGRVFDVAI